MRRAAILLAFAFSAFVCASARGEELFSVPFFIENLFPNPPSALRADFTLNHPAILESFTMDCAGGPRGGLLLVDAGPLGVHGTTGVAANSQVGLVVGGTTEVFVRIEFTASAIGNTFYSPTHLGLPVKSTYSFILFPDVPHGVSCFGNAVFHRPL